MNLDRCLEYDLTDVTKQKCDVYSSKSDKYRYLNGQPVVCEKRSLQLTSTDRIKHCVVEGNCCPDCTRDRIGDGYCD